MRPLSRPSGREPEDCISVGPPQDLTTTARPSDYSKSQDPTNTRTDNTTARIAGANNDDAKYDVRDSDLAAQPQTKTEPETKSEASYDPLFDDEPDVSAEQPSVQIKQEGGSASAFAQPTQPTSASKTSGITPAPSKPLSLQTGLVPPPKKPAIPLLDPVNYGEFSNDVLLAASIDGQVVLWDRRARTDRGVGRLEMSEKCPPWCLSVRGSST